MNKKTIFIFSFLIVLFLILASCKTEKDVLQEKRECFKECMEEEDGKEFCLEDCRLEEDDLREKPTAVCGDGICQDEEEQTSSCSEDCLPKCTSDSDCPEKYRCEKSVCNVVECTIDVHCNENETCEEDACVEEAEETLLDAIQKTIDDLDEAVDALLDTIAGLQSKLDAADASADDKGGVQEDIDALESVNAQLEIYTTNLKDYETMLTTTTAKEDAETLSTELNESQEEIEAYIEEQQAAADAIEEAIAALAPAEKPDLLIDDVDLESVDGNDATLSITYKNEGEGNMSNETFRIKLTSFDEDGDKYDDTKTTITTLLKVNEEKTTDIEVEIPYDLEQYFTTHPSDEKLNLTFQSEIDIDDTVAEEEEENNGKNVTLTFDRDDYVTNSAPIAVISANATSVYTDESIAFNASSSTDADGTIVSYSWNFGVSSTYETGETWTYSYDIAGTYTVTLIVTDNEGATDTETMTIEVTEPLSV